MKRIIMMVLRNILLVPWMWAKLCYHASHVDKYTEEELCEIRSEFGNKQTIVNVFIGKQIKL